MGSKLHHIGCDHADEHEVTPSGPRFFIPCCLLLLVCWGGFIDCVFLAYAGVEFIQSMAGDAIPSRFLSILSLWFANQRLVGLTLGFWPVDVASCITQ